MTKFFLSLIFSLCALAPLGAQTSSQCSPATPSSPPTAVAPIWGKLVISDNVVTCYYAKGITAPTLWTQIGQPKTVGFVNNPLLVGIYLSAHDGTGTPTLSTGTIDNFSITPTPTYRLTDCDIGAPSLMGSANLISGVWNLAASGSDIWNMSDQCNFQPWLVWGGVPHHVPLRWRSVAENRDHDPRRLQQRVGLRALLRDKRQRPRISVSTRLQ
jgi:hypothetical protein